MYSKIMIILVFLFALSGCTTMKTVNLEKVNLVDVVETGDHLVIFEKTGRVVDMTLTRVEDNRLIGSLTGSGLSTVEVNIDDIEKIEIEKISGLKTTGAVIGGTAIVTAAAAAMLLGAFVAGY